MLPVAPAAAETTKSFDQNKMADYSHKTPHRTIVGAIRFGQDGEWAESRIFQVQYQKIDGNGLEQFERPGTQVILFPQAYKSGKLEYPLPQP